MVYGIVLHGYVHGNVKRYEHVMSWHVVCDLGMTLFGVVLH